jgi:two-component system OmpR family response regulator
MLEQLSRGPQSEPAYRLAARDGGFRRAPRVLLAEDDPTLAALIVALLDGEGYAVVAVRNPIEAHTILRMCEFDLVLMEAFSPTWSLTTRMLAPLLRRAGATPIVILTDHSWSESSAQADGVAAIIHKPFDVNALVDRVGDFVRRDLAVSA